MKKITLFVTTVILGTMSVWAASVDAVSARSMAQDFLSDMSVFSPQTIPNSGGSSLQLIHAEASDVSMAVNAYYVFGSASGYVIVAGDDRAQRILGYGKGHFNMSDIPCSMRFMLDSYKEQIDYLLEHPGLEVETMSLRATVDEGTSIEPLLTSKWYQAEPYWMMCPMVNGQHCYTGCASTSLSQVMYYWKYPRGYTPAVPAYTTTTNQIALDELPSTTFDWDNMIDTYEAGNYTTVQAEAVAKLMRYVGQAEEMDYDPAGSGAYASAMLTAAQFFGYSENAKFKSKVNYLTNKPLFTDEQWNTMILTELNARRPIVYSAVSADDSGGHAFNIDGYDAFTQMFHINWGWGGYYDGYFALNAFSINDDPSYSFTKYQMMVIGLEPPELPEVWVDQSTLDFSASVGEAVSQSFIVNGYNLASDVILTLNDPEGYYSIDKTRITPAEAEVGVVVTVTFSPAEVGSSYAEVRLTTTGVQHEIVALNGEASTDMVGIEADVDSILFGDVEVGYPVSKTLTVTGHHLTSDINLRTETRSVNYFKVTPEVITPEQAANGVTVKVTYSPGSQYWNWGNLVLSCSDVEDVVIPIWADPYTPDNSFHNKQTLQLSAYLGQIVRETGTISFADAEIPPGPINPLVVMSNGASLMSINDGFDNCTMLPANGIDFSNYELEIEGDDCFCAMLVKTSSIANTCKVMITYSPRTLGTHQATLVATCHSAGVPVVIVYLRGEATLLTVDPTVLPAEVNFMDMTSFAAQWKMNCYDSGISDFMIECAPQGSDFNPDDTKYRCFTDLLPDECIYNGYNVLVGLGRKYSYTISDLTPGTTYEYRIKAHFIDDTWSEWSDIETVVLLGGNEFKVGDVNGDGQVSVSDITFLIDCLLNGSQEGFNGGADVNGDGQITIGDVSALIDRLLGL